MELKEISESTGIRIEILEFAMIMEAKLKANDHKKGWHDSYYDDLIARCREELNEVKKAYKKLPYNPHSEQVKDLQKECADVANFAMMISDNLKTEHNL